MVWPDVVVAIVRCEFRARYTGWGGWELTAKGALPVVLLVSSVLLLWH
jgi:hypothetical protein